MRPRRNAMGATLGIAAGLVLLAGVGSGAANVVGTPGMCLAEPEPPEYYAIELVTTKNLPGTGLAKGTADVTHRTSPFSVTLSPDGSYAYDVHVRLEGLRPPRRGVLTAWVTTTEVDEIRRIGVLDDQFGAQGSVEWNKFLVVITLEDEDDLEATMWSGPIAFRGMSRSGYMHTMAGHGPFQQENCAAYGYGR